MHNDECSLSYFPLAFFSSRLHSNNLACIVSRTFIDNPVNSAYRFMWIRYFVHIWMSRYWKLKLFQVLIQVSCSLYNNTVLFRISNSNECICTHQGAKWYVNSAKSTPNIYKFHICERKRPFRMQLKNSLSNIVECRRADKLNFIDSNAKCELSIVWQINWLREEKKNGNLIQK